MDNDVELIELPFDETFKNCWLDYVQFTKNIGGNTSISTQNWVLTRIKRDFELEEEAIEFINENKEVAFEISQRKLNRR